MNTKAELLKAARATAKRLGYTFKAQPNVTLNGKTVYMLVCRETGNVAARYMRVDEMVCENICQAIAK